MKKISKIIIGIMITILGALMLTMTGCYSISKYTGEDIGTGSTQPDNEAEKAKVTLTGEDAVSAIGEAESSGSVENGFYQSSADEIFRETGASKITMTLESGETVEVVR